MRKLNAKKRFIWIAFLILSLSGMGFGERSGDTRKEKNSRYLETALGIEKWIASTEIKQRNGIAWPYVAEKPKAVVYNLYSGMPGIVLFYLELYHATGNKPFLDKACGGADHLLEFLDSGKMINTGYYIGIAGFGFVLENVYAASGKKKYRTGVIKCLDFLRKNIRKQGEGIEWIIKYPKKDKTGFDVFSATDIMYGGAGTGLFVLHMGKKLNDPSLIELAEKAGKGLISLGIPEKGGIKWKMHAQLSRLMPNFSHGTSGNAYFLAELYRHTQKKDFLDGALAAAQYLLAAAKKDKKTCLIFHHEPGGEDLFYLGWCHGPVGTTRLFYLLHQVTGDKKWMEWVEKGARAILTSGIPEKHTPGFWNNVSRCCGTAGVAEYFLDLYLKTGNKEYLAFSKKMTADLLKRSTPAGNSINGLNSLNGSNGLKWIQAEHRVQPENLEAQTGLMQGAAGIGLWLLKLDAFEKGKKHKISFPDSPF